MEKRLNNLIVVLLAISYLGISLDCSSLMSPNIMCTQVNVFLEGTPEKSFRAGSDYRIPTDFASFSISSTGTASTVSPSPSFEDINFN
jgi:hypothetical protein